MLRVPATPFRYRSALENLTLHFPQVPPNHVNITQETPRRQLRRASIRACPTLSIFDVCFAPESDHLLHNGETLPGFDHIEWFAIVAPPRTPQPTVTVLRQAIAEALRSPDIQDRLQHVMLVPVGNT